MSVRDWWETTEGQSVTPSGEGDLHAVRTFQCITDPGDTVFTVYDYASAPQDGQGHPDNGNLLCQGGCRVYAGKGPTHWMVEAEYFARNFASATGDPLDRAWRIDYDWVASREPIEYAFQQPADATPSLLIANTAGEPYDPPLEEDVYDPVVVLKRNVAAATAKTDILLNNTLNSDTVNGFAALKLRFLVEEHPVYGGSTIAYYEETIRILIRNVDWGHKRRLANVGYRRLSGGLLIPGTDVNGQPLTRPRPLNNNGDDWVAAASVEWNLFQTIQAVAWSGVGLPAF